MVSQRIPEDISSSELKREAERRELVERALLIYGRRASRNKVVHAILNISFDDIKECGAYNKFYTLMAGLVSDEVEDRKQLPTNGEVNLLGNRDWWSDWNIQIIKTHPAIHEFEIGRRTELGSLSSLYSEWME